MKARLDTPFADTRAADLSLAYRLAPLPALGTHLVRLAGFELELRLLGASHQVVFGGWSETVACLSGGTGDLPPVAEAVDGDLRVRFEAVSVRLTAQELAARTAEITRVCAADDHALVGEFPGDQVAVTALAVHAEPGGVGWRTWHSYPQTGELVETRSVVLPT